MSSFLQELAEKTGMHYLSIPGMFKGSNGCVVGFRDDYLIGIGVPQEGLNKVVCVYVRTKDSSRIKELQDAVKNDSKVKKVSFTPVIQARSEALVWSFSWPFLLKADKMQEALDAFITILKLYIPPFPINKCEECGKTNNDIVLLNGTPNFPCPECQVMLREKYDSRMQEYLNTDPQRLRGFIFGLGAAIVGGYVWGIIAYASIQDGKYYPELFALFFLLVIAGIAHAFKYGIKRIDLFAKISVVPLSLLARFIGDTVLNSLVLAKHYAVIFNAVYLVRTGSLWLLIRWSLNPKKFYFLLDLLLVALAWTVMVQIQPKLEVKFLNIGPAKRTHTVWAPN